MKSSLRNITGISAALVILIGLSGLIGWSFNIPFIKSISSGMVAIKVNACISFLLTGSLILIYLLQKKESQKYIINIFIILFFLINLLTAIEYISGIDLGIDQIFFTDYDIISTHPGRMAPNTVLLFLITGIALLFLLPSNKLKKNSFAAGILGLIVSSAGFFSFAIYPWGGSINILGHFNPMAIQASIGFTILGISIFALSLKMTKLQWSLKRSITIGIILGLALLIGVNVFSNISIINVQETLREVSQTREVEYQLSKLSSLLMEMEHHRQNYLLTGKKEYRDIINNLWKSINTEIEKFGLLTKNNPAQQVRAAQLKDMFSMRKDLLEKTFSEFEIHGSKVISDLLFLQKRDDIINKINRLIDDAENEEKRILIIWQKNADVSSQRTFFLLPLGTFASLAILVWIFMLLNSEVTERLRSEDALKKSEEKLRLKNLYNRTLLEVNLDPLVTISPEGKIRDVNSAVEKITGLSREELLGSDFSSYFTDPAKANESYKKVFLDGSVHDYYLIIQHKSGKKTDVLYNAVTYKNEVGKIEGVFAAARDITEIKRKEEELSKANENLNRSNQELEQFVYVASHDLQEPLRMVSSFTQLLGKRYSDKLDDDAREFINYAVDGANRMQRLINDLLEYSRVTTKGKPLVKVDLSVPLGMAVSNLRNKIQESGAVILNDELPCVKGDEIQLMQLFQNLIDNAIKFSSKELPQILIKSRVKENIVIVSVQDNGIGIDQKYKDRIFVIFNRLHGSKDYPGTGIGLAICKRIVERHGGKIWFDSEPGKGTTFNFYLNKIG